MSVRPSVGPKVRPSVCPVLFLNDEYGHFEVKKSSNDIIINDTMSDDEVVASDVPPRYLFTLGAIPALLTLSDDCSLSGLVCH